MTTTLAPAPHRVSSRPGPVRLTLASVAVLSCLPYLALKVHWLLGGSIGLNDATVATSTSMEVANLLTAGMEAVGAALAVLLILPVGRRIPAPLLGVPMFVGTGLLGGILLLVPVQLLLADGASSAEATQSDPIRAWVYVAVYGGFMVLGVCLLTIFSGYAWQRWVMPGGWTARVGALPEVAAAVRARVLRRGTVSLLVCTAGAVLSLRDDTFAAHDVVAIVAATVALAGLAALATGRPRRLRAHLPLLMTYLGSAVVAAWGAFFAVMLLVPNPLVGQEHTPWGPVAVGALRAITGLLVVLTLRDLAPRARRTTAG